MGRSPGDRGPAVWLLRRSRQKDALPRLGRLRHGTVVEQVAMAYPPCACPVLITTPSASIAQSRLPESPWFWAEMYAKAPCGTVNWTPSLPPDLSGTATPVACWVFPEALAYVMSMLLAEPVTL